MSNFEFIHVKYCSDISELSKFLKKLNPEQLISVTEKVGYTIIWKSSKEYGWQDHKR